MANLKSIAEWAAWKGEMTIQFPSHVDVLWLVLRARTAMGDGKQEEQLIRLMVWVGATFMHGAKHTGIRHPLGLLKTREGWCDQQARMFCFLAYHFLDLPGRTVSVKNMPPPPGFKLAGHTVAEVFYNKSWHLFDVHKDHQAVYRGGNGQLLSVAELRESPELAAQQVHWWKAYKQYGKDGFYRSSIKPTYTPLDFQGEYAWPWSSKP